MKISIEDIKKHLRQRHSYDKKQLEVIFSNKSRLLVVAPAGYGKTKTMISKIAYMLATGQIPYPKKLLALTFSVNAAYKIKKDVSQQIPEILGKKKFDIDKKLFVSNYHGFCRGVLKKYGYLIHDNLRRIDMLKAIDDSDIQQIQQIISGLTYEDAKKLTDFNDAVKKVNEQHIKDNIANYNQLITKELLSREVISFNAILTLTIELFKKYPKILKFYHNFFTSILVDEYQDTNILSDWLIHLLVTNKTKLILLGDSLQRIYGFIGAIPNLLNKSKKHFGLDEIELAKNYRFSDNRQMLLLDTNIRKNAANPYSPDIKEEAEIIFCYLENQEEETNKIIEIIQYVSTNNPGSKIAILVKQRGNNINRIIAGLEEKSIPFFYGLFTDEEPQYVRFNSKCLYEFIDLIKQNDKITKKGLKKLENQIKKEYADNPNPLVKSLIKLLSIFLERIFIDFAFLDNEDKKKLIKDTFEYNGLRQYLEFVDSNIIVSTVHGAKGLEWDYVILPDMEAYLFPNWPGLCGVCQNKSDCNLVVTVQIESKFLEELSVFYVAVTRAKKQVFFTASKYQMNHNRQNVERNISCFLKLRGITMNMARCLSR